MVFPWVSCGQISPIFGMKKAPSLGCCGLLVYVLPLAEISLFNRPSERLHESHPLGKAIQEGEVLVPEVEVDRDPLACRIDGVEHHEKYFAITLLIQIIDRISRSEPLHRPHKDLLELTPRDHKRSVREDLCEDDGEARSG